MTDRQREPIILIGLGLIAAAYFALGCTRSLEWIDEGQIIYPSWRVSQGAFPYRDFRHLYGPSLFFWNGALFRHFGPDLLVVRVSLVALKSLTAVLVYLLARRVAARPFAILVSACLVGVWGAPWWVFNTPYANHYALTLDLAGLLLFLSLPRGFHLGCALAGLCFGLATTFKQTSGIFALIAFALFLVLAAQRASSAAAVRPAPAQLTSFVPRGVFVAVLMGALGIFAVYLWPRNSAWNLFLVLTPAAAAVGLLAGRELRGAVNADAHLRSLSGLACAAAGLAIPPMVCAAYYGAAGFLPELVFDTVTGLPRKTRWFAPVPALDLRTVLCSAVAFTALAAVRLWRTVPRQGPRGRRTAAHAATGMLAVALMLLVAHVASSDGLWRHLWNDGWQGDAIRLTFVLPWAVVWMSCVMVLRRARPQSSGEAPAPEAFPPRETALALLYCHAVTALLSFYPAADYWHLVMALPAFLPLLAHLLERFHQVDGGAAGTDRAWRYASGALAGALVAITAGPPVKALVTARRQPPGEAGGLARATGILGAPPKFAEVVALMRSLESEAPAGHDLLVMTGEQMLYFLAGRHSVFEGEEFIIYLVAAGLIADQDARDLAGESRMLERLAAARPVVIDAVDSPTAQRFKTVFAGVARYVDEHYRCVREIGTYRVLEWTSPSAAPASSSTAAD